MPVCYAGHMEVDEILIEKILTGEQTPFEILVARHTPTFYSFVYRMTRGSIFVDDIVQESWIKIWKSLKQFDPKYSFRSWGLTIVRNTALDFLRKKQPILFSQFETDHEISLNEIIPDTEKPPDELFLEREEGEAVKRAVATLASLDQEIVILHLTEELTFEEISATLHIPMNTVKSRYRRALTKLKVLLEKHAPKS